LEQNPNIRQAMHLFKQENIDIGRTPYGTAFNPNFLFISN
jgi:hypothetical protein